MDAIVTNHAEKRIRKRCGLNKSVVSKLATQALTEGISHSETKGNFKKYLNKLYLSDKNANNIKIYNHFVFLFNSNTLITVFNLPRNLHAVVDKIKSHINNPVK